MMTTFEIIQIVIGSGMALGILKLVFSVGKTAQSFKSMGEKIDTMAKDIKELRTDLKETNKDIRSLDNRISRIEGVLTGPYHWEPRIIKKEDPNGD